MQLLEIDIASAVPIWRQIEDGVRRLVASGQLEPGAAIPSVRELSRSLRVNPATVSKAYQRLTETGLLEVRRGEGTYVADLDDERLALERCDLLAHGASGFVALAKSLSTNRNEAIETLTRMWNQIDEGGQGEGDD